MHPEVWEKEMNSFVARTMDGQNVQIMIGDRVLEVQVASSEESHKAGLSLHDSIPFSGMLFMYANDNTTPFTRKEMDFPIDIRFYDGMGELVAVSQHDAGISMIADCEDPYRYVLETAPMDLSGRLQLIKL